VGKQSRGGDLAEPFPWTVIQGVTHVFIIFEKPAVLPTQWRPIAAEREKASIQGVSCFGSIHAFSAV